MFSCSKQELNKEPHWQRILTEQGWAVCLRLWHCLFSVVLDR